MKFRALLFLLLSCFLFTGIYAQAPCDVISVLPNLNPAPLYSPDSSMYLINKPDTAGVFQVYVGHTGDTAATCISLVNPWSLWRPWSQRNKMQVQWSPTGNFIICGVEKEFYNELLYVPYSIRLGLLESGIWMDIMACTPDGNTWYNLATTIHGFTGPAFTPAGTQCAWAEALDSSNLSVDVFGDWKLRLSQYSETSGTPSFSSTNDITPAGARWIEPGNFSPDGVSLLVSSDIGLINAEGQDQYIINISNGQVTNLTNSPIIWDEHGVFSPDGTKILFMSSYPYQADTNSYHTLTIKTEFMLMDPDGMNLQQLTHYCDTGYVESGAGIAATGFWGHGDSTIYAQSLLFPAYNDWKIKFHGDCGYSVTSVNEISSPGGVVLYPDPAGNMLTVQTDFLLHDATVILWNATGQMVKIIPGAGGNTVHILTNDLPPGIYFLGIQNGSQTVTKKFVKAG
ncbi:MAG TPA: T9SS type A sorting domain-containing protein [Bacteroidia bacterium]|nr:T9SS type A sorting domain-containing protein [Bacteroidia bacterium]